MIVLRECQIRPGKTQGDAKQYLPEIEMGHSKGSSGWEGAPILYGVIGNEDNVFGWPARKYRKGLERAQSAVPGRRDLRFNGNAHKLGSAADRRRNQWVKVVAN
jgi:hypothetical protein